MKKLICGSVYCMCLLLLFLLAGMNTIILGKGRMSLPGTFLISENPEPGKQYNHKKPIQKIISLILFSDQTKKDKFTMLVAYNTDITSSIRNILKKDVTPLICSVSAFPLATVEFLPDDLVFEQNGNVWSPANSEEALEMFALSAGSRFGGKLKDSEVQQGVILLPGWFNLKEPVHVTYKGISKRIRFSYR